MQDGSKRIRYAVVGAGNIAQVAVLPAFEHARDNSELVGLVSSDPAKRAELAERYRLDSGAVGSYDELEQVLERARADAVYITVPNHLHCEYTERAARAGCHVLCEKPMATSVRECEAMIEATRAAGVKLMIAYRLHFEEANLRAIEVLRSGRLGEARMFSSVFSQQVRPGDIRTRPDEGGGALFDLGPYCINAARNAFGTEPVRVFARQIQGRDERSRRVDETTSAVLLFEEDRIGQFIVSQGAAGTSSYRIVGTEGSLRVEPAYEYDAEIAHYLSIGDEATEQRFAPRDQFAPELLYFSDCILSDKNPEPSGIEGLADIRIIEALMESARSGRPVDLAPFDKKERPKMEQNIYRPPVEQPSPVHAPPPSQS